MRKLKFVGLFIAAGLLMQSAYADCSNPTRQTGGQLCMVVGSDNAGNMSVYTCQSNGKWENTGGKCTCPWAPPSGEVILDSPSGTTMYCAGAYTTSQASANMTYASNGLFKPAQ